MVKNFLLATCLTAGVALTQPATADAVSDGIAAMPGTVQHVRHFGDWQRDGRSGVYRIVIARSSAPSVTARLFVQWLSPGSSGTLTVENSIEISEIADRGLDIADYVSESDAEGLAMYIDVIDPPTGNSEEYELFIFAPDEYRFDTATN